MTFLDVLTATIGHDLGIALTAWRAAAWPSAMVATVCRLFGMSGGREPVRATFWLLEAPDSLAEQSRREPDGTGLGSFDATARRSSPSSRWPRTRTRSSRARRARSPRARSSPTSATRRPARSSPENTHPFEQRGRLFAHNGVIEDLDRLEAELGDDAVAGAAATPTPSASSR